MKTLVKSFMCCCAVLLSVAVSADVLYWQVNFSDGAPTGFDYSESTSAARLMAYSNDTPSPTGDQLYTTKLYTQGGWIDGATADIISGGTGSQYSAFDGLSGSGYSFFIEIGNYTGDTFTGTHRYYLSTSELQSYVYTSSSIAPGRQALALTGASAFRPVPEPTSGLLLVIGGALLALRRRRQI